MVENPYLEPARLPILIGLIQAMSVRTIYKATLDVWQERFPTLSIDQLKKIFEDHPEFFRCSNDDGNDYYSLIYRRFLPRLEGVPGMRPPLEPEQTKLLIEAAANLYSWQLEHSRNWRWWWTVLAPVIGGILAALIATQITS